MSNVIHLADYVAPIPANATAVVEDEPHLRRGATFEVQYGDGLWWTGTVSRRRKQPDGTVKLWLDETRFERR